MRSAVRQIKKYLRHLNWHLKFSSMAETNRYMTVQDIHCIRSTLGSSMFPSLCHCTQEFIVFTFSFLWPQYFFLSGTVNSMTMVFFIFVDQSTICHSLRLVDLALFWSYAGCLLLCFSFLKILTFLNIVEWKLNTSRYFRLTP